MFHIGVFVEIAKPLEEKNVIESLNKPLETPARVSFFLALAVPNSPTYEIREVKFSKTRIFRPTKNIAPCAWLCKAHP